LKIDRNSLDNLILCDQVLHNWGRILGRVGEICVPKASDFSHLSFRWNPKTESLQGSPFSSRRGDVFHELNLVEKNIAFKFSQAKSGDEIDTISTHDTSYWVVMDLLEMSLDDLGFKDSNVSRKVEFRFPEKFSENGEAVDISAGLNLWKFLRTVANEACQQMLEAMEKTSSILIWPTNFDTGVFCDYGNGITQFAGFSPADDKVSDIPYFYNSFYKRNQPVVPKDPEDLRQGYWESTKWSGAVLPIDKCALDSILITAQEFLVNSSHLLLSEC
jgi:hypothetical protein